MVVNSKGRPTRGTSKITWQYVHRRAQWLRRQRNTQLNTVVAQPRATSVVLCAQDACGCSPGAFLATTSHVLHCNPRTSCDPDDRLDDGNAEDEVLRECRRFYRGSAHTNTPVPMVVLMLTMLMRAWLACTSTRMYGTTCVSTPVAYVFVAIICALCSSTCTLHVTHSCRGVHA